MDSITAGGLLFDGLRDRRRRSDNFGDFLHKITTDQGLAPAYKPGLCT
jgi:hypothetical protein